MVPCFKIQIQTINSNLHDKFRLNTDKQYANSAQIIVERIDNQFSSLSMCYLLFFSGFSKRFIKSLFGNFFICENRKIKKTFPGLSPMVHVPRKLFPLYINKLMGYIVGHQRIDIFRGSTISPRILRTVHLSLQINS